MPYINCDVEFIKANKGPISEVRHTLLLIIAMMDYSLYMGVECKMVPRPYCDHYILSLFYRPGESPIRNLN